MNVFARLCLVLGGLFAVDAMVFWSVQHEHLGTALLAMTAAGFALLGLYGGAALRRARRQAEVHASEEPHVAPTIWPVVFALSAVGITLGLLVAPWLLVVGGILFAAAGVGWTADTRRQWRHDEHAPSETGGSETTDGR